MTIVSGASGGAANTVNVFENAQALSRFCAQLFVARALAAVADEGRFMVALAGGSTPRGLYSLLESEPAFREKVPWSDTHFFWGDERHAPPSHPESNYRMAAESMLSKVPVPMGNVHRVLAENPNAGEAARLYEDELRRAFAPPAGSLPRFDLVLLGLGADGHTASLFPGSDAVHERSRWVVAPWVEKLKAFRITLTPVVLNHAADVVFLVAGEDKAEALTAVLESGRPPQELPAKCIRPTSGTLSWLVDRASARRLSSPARMWT